MSDKNDNSAKPSGNDEKSGWGTAIAGAAIGSAALAAALLFASRRRDNRKDQPAHPEEAPETD